MARVTVRDVMGARHRGAESQSRDVPAGFTSAAAASTRAAAQPQTRAGNFLEVAEASADTLRQLLGVDRVMIMSAASRSPWHCW